MNKYERYQVLHQTPDPMIGITIWDDYNLHWTRVVEVEEISGLAIYIFENRNESGIGYINRMIREHGVLWV